jgi:micrococcal nuclease
VVDGDTIKVAKIGGRARRNRITVRLIGVDSPETRAPDTPVECGGREATSYMLAASFTAATDTDGDGLFDTKGGEGREVVLETDQSQDLYDEFGRLLAYAEVAPDGAPVDLGEAMLGAGWAEVFVFDRDFRRVRPYRRVAAEARAAGAGAHTACGGEFHRAP